MCFRFSIRLSGAGGHGLIQAARILAEAVAVYDNKNAAESCSYGPEARGNASCAEIVISDEAIDCPKVGRIDVLLALTQEAYDKHVKDIRDEGILVTDTDVQIDERCDGKVHYSVPLLKVAESKLNKLSMVNILALGFLSEICDVLDKESIAHAILARVPRMSEDIFIEAFEAGLAVAIETLAGTGGKI